MSYTTIIHVFPNDRIECGKELRNSWGSAPVIWDLMSQKYLGKDPHRYGDLSPLWALWKDQSVPLHHRAVLMMTFDKAYIAKKDYLRAAKDIDLFFDDFFYSSEYVNHWPAISLMLEGDPDIPGIGFWHTSVSDNPFNGPWNEDKEEYETPNWEHVYDIYAELENAAITQS